MSDANVTQGGHRRRTTIRSPETPSSWGERFQALRTVPPLLKMVYRAHRGFMVATLAFRLLQALAPVTMLWVGKAHHRGGGALLPGWGACGLVLEGGGVIENGTHAELVARSGLYAELQAEGYR